MQVYVSLGGDSINATFSLFEDERKENEQQLSVTLTARADIMRDASAFERACRVVHDVLSDPLYDMMEGARSL